MGKPERRRAGRRMGGQRPVCAGKGPWGIKGDTSDFDGAGQSRNERTSPIGPILFALRNYAAVADPKGGSPREPVSGPMRRSGGSDRRPGDPLGNASLVGA